MGETFVKRTPMPVSAAELFAWHERPGAFERLNPPFAPVKVLERSNGLQVGARTAIELKLGPLPTRWVAEHTACQPGVMFRDEQREGPFSKWVHTHRMLAQPDGTSVLEDEVEYALPLGALGQLFGGGTARAALERMFAYRHALTRHDLTRHLSYAGAPRLTVAITGATGLIGTALSGFLSTGGHRVRAVKRGDFSALEGADAVVHLAGANVGQRWAAPHRRALVTSRVDYTRALVQALERLSQRPRQLLSGSAIGVYGDRGDEAVTESSSPGERGERGAAFLAGLCADWEAEGLEARALGLEVACLRTGVVLTANGGALGKLLTPFRAGVGGPSGSGRQWLSHVSLEDTVGAIHSLLMRRGVQGPVNVVGPSPVTNAQLAGTLGRVLSRPTFAAQPAFVLEAMFGEMAGATILAGQKVLPAVLQARGFRFLFPDLESSLRFTLGR